MKPVLLLILVLLLVAGLAGATTRKEKKAAKKAAALAAQKKALEAKCRKISGLFKANCIDNGLCASCLPLFTRNKPIIYGVI